MVTVRILICDNLPSFRRGLAEALRVRGWIVVEANSETELERALATGPFDVLLVDPIALDGGTIGLPARLERWQRDLDVLLMTHSAASEVAATIHGKAAGTLRRPFDLDELELRVLRLRRAREDGRELRHLRAILFSGGRLHGFSDDTPCTREVCDKVRLFADQTAPVVVTGEQGTGKKLVAAALHELGQRCAGPFVTARCLDAPAEATARVLASLEQARGGTLLLHGVEGCDAALQDHLSVLLCAEDRPRAGGGELDADVRIIATTALDLERAVQAGLFRADLWAVLRRLEIRLPAMRDRGDDILVLAGELLQALAGDGRTPKTLSSEAAVALRRYAWPGNVTELREVLAAAVAAAPGQDIASADLSTRVTDTRRSGPPFRLHLETAPAVCLPDMVLRLERELVEWALERSHGDPLRAAEILGVPADVVERFRARSGSC